jgi:filamentous hemagglutinin family protein
MPVLADAHPTSWTARGSGSVGGTSPAVRLPKVEPLPVKRMNARRAAVIAAPAVTGTTTLTPQGNAGTVITHTGNTYTITGGTLANGGDLLHSFDSFNLLNGDTADFLAAANVKTIVARVTGGAATIDGTLAAHLSTNTAQIHPANLFLIDPAGVMFTGNAHLQLGGSFAVTTADSIRLSDGLLVNASTAAPLSLQTSGPAGFVFNSASTGSLTFSSTNASVVAGQNFTAVGGTVSLDAATITAPAGRVNLIATASPGTVALDGSDRMSTVDVSSLPTLAAVSITDGSLINTDGDAGGRISIRGSALNLANSSLSAQTTGSGDGLGVDLAFTSDVTTLNSAVVTSTNSTGNAGNITLAGTALSISGLDPSSNSIDARSLPTGAGGSGGDVTIDGADITLANGANISTRTSSTGRGGNITLNGSSLSISGGAAGLFANTDGAGTGGNIKLILQGALSIDGTANPGKIGIQASTVSTAIGAGAGGNVTISAGSVDLTQGATVGTDSFGAGSAGFTLITAQSLSLTNGAQIASTTGGTGQGGDLTVNITGAMTFSGTIDGQFSGLVAGTTLTSPGGGASGNVMVTAGSLSVLDGGQIDATTRGTGAGGNITLNIAGQMTIDGGPNAMFSGVGAQSLLGTPGGGTGGNVTISAGSLSVLDGTVIDTDAFGTAAGGDITVNVSGLVTLDGGTSGKATGIAAETALATEGGGRGGDISLTAGSLSVMNGAALSASTYGTGAGGNVSVSISGQATFDEGISPNATGIAAESNLATAGGGSGGDVTFKAASLSLLNGASVDASTQTTGNGGTVTVIISGGLMIDDGTSSSFGGIASQSSYTGPGGGKAGDISVWAASLSVLNFAGINADTFGTGTGGNVTVNVTGQALFDTGTSGIANVVSANSGMTSPGGGNGGNVVLNVGTLSVLDQALISAGTSGTGAGGSVTVNVSGAALLDARISGNTSGINAQSTTVSPGAGNGGNVTVTAASLTIANGAEIQSVTTGTGTAGDVTVRVSGDLTLNDNNGIGMTSISSDSGNPGMPAAGAAGKVTVSANTLHILDGAGITSDAYGSGNAGDVSVTVIGQSTLDAQQSGNFTGISADTNSTSPGGGRGGDVQFNTGLLALVNGAEIDASTFGTGNGGSLTVNVAGGAVLEAGADGSDIVAQSTMIPPGGGHGGDVTVTAGIMELLYGAEIDSSSFGTGNGGSVRVAVRQLLLLDGGNSGSFTGIAAQNNGDGNAGNVSITAGEINLSNSATVSVTAAAVSATAGDISLVSSSNIRLGSFSQVTAMTAGTGGNIKMSAPNLIYVSASSITAQAAGAGGGITIDPQLVVLTNGSVIDGLSGSLPKPVIVGAEAFLVSTDSQILTVRPRFAVDDTVASTIGRLPGGITGAGVTLADQCGVIFTTDNISSFVVTGRGGTPVEPGGWLPQFDLSDGSVDGGDGDKKRRK